MLDLDSSDNYFLSFVAPVNSDEVSVIECQRCILSLPPHRRHRKLRYTVISTPVSIYPEIDRTEVLYGVVINAVLGPSFQSES